MSVRSSSTQAGSLQGQYAGFVSRLIAFVLDRIIIWTVILIINTILIVILGFFNLSLEQILNLQNNQNILQTLFTIFFFLLVISINFVLYNAYFIVFWMLVGQTPGKMIMGVRIVSTDGSPVGFFQSVRRLIGYWISMIIVFLGFLWVLISDTRQGWHDKIANTYVIYSWEARGGYRFFNQLSQIANERSLAYGRKHAPSLSTNTPQNVTESDQET